MIDSHRTATVRIAIAITSTAITGRPYRRRVGPLPAIRCWVWFRCPTL
jgi:hypothetical protein